MKFSATCAKERVVALLWVLLRDHVPFGVMEEIFKDHFGATAANDRNYDDAILEKYVRSLADRL